MPRELSAAEERAFARYEALGTPEELQTQAKELEKVKSEAADKRQKVKELESELATAKAAVPEGAKVLTADEAKTWERYVALGTPEQAEALKAERDTLAEKVATTERETTFAKVAKVSGLAEEAAAAMLDMRSLDGATWEFKTAKVRDPRTGKDVDAEEAYVTLAGEGQKQQKFSEYRDATASLRALPKAGETGGTGNAGVPVPEQRGSTGNGPGSAAGGVEDLIARNQAAAKGGNPLLPKKVAA